MTDFRALPDLASERLGGAAIAANDDFFAPMENLVRPEAPVFDPDRYTERGKWMDGWETRRRREPGHDWCIVRLGAPGIVRGVVVDTSHFRGNHPEACSIEGCAVQGEPDLATLEHAEWTELLPRKELQGHEHNAFEIECPYRFTHLRLRIYPDGGVARLRVHGEALPHFGREAAGGLVDLGSAALGARVVDCSDAFFASQGNLLLPEPARGMADGWETRRRRGPGNDWVVVRLAAPGSIRRVVVDTSHYKGNAPGRCTLEATRMESDSDAVPADAAWQCLVGEVPLKPHTVHRLIDEVQDLGPVTHVRLHILPDGGVARLRLYGALAGEELDRQGVRWLDALPPEAARRALGQCCGSSRWVERMIAARPFGEPDRLMDAADAHWRELGREDWLEAFRAHPRIGEREADKQTGATASRWSSQEQSAVQQSAEGVKARIAEGNRRYEQRFGFLFLIRASGKGPEQILAALEQRLEHDPEHEIEVAAEEQRQITRLRLQKLLTT